VSNPKFSILIVNHRTLQLTKNCLESIRSCSQGSSYEIIVVDNASNDDSLAYLRQQNDIQLIERHDGLHYGPQDHGEGLDVGMRDARGEFLVIVDSDVIVLQEGWLDALDEILMKEDAVLIGPSFYREFIHPCLLVIKRQVTDRYGLSFAPRTYFHRYFDTAEYVTHVLRKHGHSIVKLHSWIGNGTDSDSSKPFDGTEQQRWGKEGAPLVAKYGAFIGGLAYHAFYGTRILNSDCDGSFEAVEARRVEPATVLAAAPRFRTSYELLVDHRSSLQKVKDELAFAGKACNWSTRHVLGKLHRSLRIRSSPSTTQL
jgi:glycosyltransferase involved in cell wall biosynthesis